MIGQSFGHAAAAGGSAHSHFMPLGRSAVLVRSDSGRQLPKEAVYSPRLIGIDGIL